MNAGATKAIAQALLRSLTFRTLGDTPSQATRTLNFVVTDGDGGTSNTGVKQVTVDAVNDRPVVALAGTVSYTENGGPRILSTNTTVSDPDSPNFAGGTLTVRIAQNRGNTDELAIKHTGNAAGQIGVVGANVRFEEPRSAPSPAARAINRW